MTMRGIPEKVQKLFAWEKSSSELKIFIIDRMNDSKECNGEDVISKLEVEHRELERVSGV
jgi:hypothetical protein